MVTPLQSLSMRRCRQSEKNFIHSFYSASSSPLLLRGAPDTTRILCRNFTPIPYRQLRVKDFPKVPRWRLERDLNPRPSGRNIISFFLRPTAIYSTNEPPRPLNLDLSIA